MEDFNGIKEGTVIKGRVVRKSDGDVFVDINYKSEGIIPKDETIKYTYFDALKEGDEIEVYIKKIDGDEGNVLLSKIIVDKKIIFNNIRKAYKESGSIDGKVIKAIKGGYIVDFGANVTAFLPISHSKSYEGDAIGKVLPLKVIQIDEERRNVVVSYKEYMAAKQQAEEGKVKKLFPTGEKIQLTITEVKDNGLEAEKEGIKCFIPTHEISWARIHNLGEKFKAGDVVDVLVIGNERDRILLSMKKLTENPFVNFIKDKKPGDKIKVKIKEILNEGLLVELSPDLDGFVHISELSYLRRINNIGDFYKAGDEVGVVIVKIDEQESKIYLSVKRTEKNPWANMEERISGECMARGHGQGNKGRRRR